MVRWEPTEFWELIRALIPYNNMALTVAVSTRRPRSDPPPGGQKEALLILPYSAATFNYFIFLY